ncbi:MAG TPA: pyruvate dehydrogenase complex dihydrolipoamide acetyltransferase [Sandaracinaceae bacterium LLY-WYZ-13_1]|nr:pyruvate dehydrogenase complex dihydrolipoamide acetyltransferase [Sandaracinaceae bacterium LLY-WYZ-13_1]
MAKIVGLPKLSPTMEEGTLARWAVSEGDRVEVDDLVAEIETDKATMEWRAFDPGVILKILVPEGEILAPDAPVAIFGEEGEDISALLAEVAKGDAGSNGDGAEAAGAAATSGAPGAEAPEAVPAAPREETPAPSRPSGGRVLASPLVRRLGREHDIDLSQVPGSGPGGRIIKRDIDEWLAGPRPTPGAPARGERRPPRVEKLTSMRRTIARRLTESKQTVPHFYLTIDTDAGPLMAARKQINAHLADDGEKVSVNDLILKACAVALRRVPEANASFAGDAIHYHQVVDVSVAVAVPDGLVTPVVRDADLKGVREISREVRDLATRARDKKLMPEEMTDGTFSLSNLGMYGIEDFAAVINPPEGMILAVGTVREEPVVKDGQIVPGQRMRATLSCDHRVVDGALGARWLAAFKDVLEQPVLMLV